jgi:hypothetical protein
VEFVVIGGFAAVVRGSSLPTKDIDVIPGTRGVTGSGLPEDVSRCGYVQTISQLRLLTDT